MRAHIKLGKVFGIELGLHYSWLIIATLIAVSLAAHFRTINTGWPIGVVWAAALITSILFFAGLFAHELSHALVARSRNIPVRRITLFALGGVAQIEKEASDPGTEFWIAIVGPITSCVMGAILLGIAHGIGWTPPASPSTPLLAVLVWLGYINIALGAFNMVPGFPLDGGRVFRAIIWKVTGNPERATRIASRAGELTGFLLILYGISRFFTGAGFGGLWLCFLGWFLLDAARANYLSSEASTLLKDLRAGDLMSRECVSLDGQLSVQQFVDEQLLRSAQRCFVVEEAGHVAGLITAGEVRATDRSRWPEMQIHQIMQPLDRVRAIEPDTPIIKAAELMAREDLNQLPVISDEHIQGMITRDRIFQVLQSRMQLAPH
jgi:Zn-dependent protease/CBS domain-containing protein